MSNPNPNTEPPAAEPNLEAASAASETQRGAGQLLVELGPVIVFVAAYNILKGRIGTDAIYYAVGSFMAAMAAAALYSFVRTKKVPPLLLVTTVLVLVFGSATIFLREPSLIQLKATIVNLLYAGAIFGSLLVGRNIWKMLFQHAFTLPDRVWRILAVRWGAFFLFMAALNEAIRHFMSFDFWVNTRLWIVFPLVLAFGLINLPITLKHAGKTE